MSPTLPVVLPDLPSGTIKPFAMALTEHSIDYRRKSIRVAQINIGKLCNLACKHCHVEAGPKKTRENMDLCTVKRVIELVEASAAIETVDITGGAPEMNPHFRLMVAEMRRLGLRVIDRCNLTVLCMDAQRNTAQFLADHQVEVVASLPCYLSDNVDKQRGRGVFDESIEGLHQLNALGYGHPDSGLVLDLVYNPLGPTLPPTQESLESAYKQHLQEHFDVQFNRLFCIVNMPIKRFHRDLQKSGRLITYMKLLEDNFNASAAQRVMCLDMVSIGWDGKLFDCDFNQMLELPLTEPIESIWDINSLAELEDQRIAVADHCYGCTAGCGSSCGGELVS